MTETAIVILNWNTKDYLQQFLPGLIEHSQQPGVEIVVADNGSNDGSVQFLEKNFPKVRLIRLDKNYGFTGGYNKALSQIKARYYLILNSDIKVTPEWIEPMRSIMEKDPSVGACMPKIKSYHKTEFFEYAGAAGGFIDKLGYPFCRGRIIDVLEEDRGQYNDETEIFWATGACMMIRADLFNELGGFDDDFFAHMEEIDLCWRMKHKGYKIMYTPESTIYHIGGGTLSSDSPFKLYLNYRNNLSLLYKNVPSKYFITTLLERTFLDIASAFVYLIQGKPKSFLAVFKAHMKFFGNLKPLTQKRKQIHRNEKRFPLEVFKKSMLYEFYFRKKKYYRQLTDNH